MRVPLWILLFKNLLKSYIYVYIYCINLKLQSYIVCLSSHYFWENPFICSSVSNLPTIYNGSAKTDHLFNVLCTLRGMHFEPVWKNTSTQFGCRSTSFLFLARDSDAADKRDSCGFVIFIIIYNVSLGASLFFLSGSFFDSEWTPSLKFNTQF